MGLLTDEGEPDEHESTELSVAGDSVSAGSVLGRRLSSGELETATLSPATAATRDGVSWTISTRVG